MDGERDGFERWFDGSAVTDAEGRPLVLWHATHAEFDAFRPQRGKDSGFHFGTEAQARMRGGRQARLIRVHLSARRLKRVRDTGSWSAERIARIRREGWDGVVYLNRYEGLSTERIEALHASGTLARLDRMSDREFRRAVPEARDSYVVFEPWQVKAVDNPGTWSRRDDRFMDAGPREAPEQGGEPEPAAPRM